MTKLEIICELRYDNRNYYVDKDKLGELRFYKIASGVKCPESPIVSFEKFNDEKYYNKIMDVSLYNMLNMLYVNKANKKK